MKPVKNKKKIFKIINSVKDSDKSLENRSKLTNKKHKFNFFFNVYTQLKINDVKQIDKLRIFSVKHKKF